MARKEWRRGEKANKIGSQLVASSCATKKNIIRKCTSCVADRHADRRGDVTHSVVESPSGLGALQWRDVLQTRNIVCDGGEIDDGVDREEV